jgi:nanoRNase/pAp phosphatase (c-di-AMP/oligoRNAs hydrolase)
MTLQPLSIHSVNPVNPDQLESFRHFLYTGPVLITTHDNPDPDAMASGKALKKLIHGLWGIPTQLLYTGLVGRAENRAMLRLLTPEWEHIDTWDKSWNFSSIVFVDCQPGSRNTIPIGESLPMLVIDHHYPIIYQSRGAVYADIRSDVGSTVTMIYQYLEAAHVDVDPILATAMFIGLKSDTNGLSKGAAINDGIVYVKLLERLDRQALLKIETSGLAQEYYQAFYQGIQDARIYGKAIIAHLGAMHRPDLTAELADLIFRYEDVHAALCSGVYNKELLFSVRTGLCDQDAGLLVQNIIFSSGKAGGHGLIAGGQIPVDGENIQDLVLQLELRFLANVGEPAIAKALLRDR